MKNPDQNFPDKSRKGTPPNSQGDDSHPWSETVNIDPNATLPLTRFNETRSERQIADSTLSQGQVIGGYRLERHLGRGGFAEVWEAVRQADNRRLALKMLQLSPLT